MAKIAIIEDDPSLNQAIRLILEKSNHQVIQAFRCHDVEAILSQSIDLVLLDINLGDGDGFSLCDKYFQPLHLPVLFITARDEEIDMLRAYEHGCEDYIVKPFSMNVLLKRIEVVMRRHHIESYILTYKDIKLHSNTREVYRNDVLLHLTTKEYEVFYMLMKHKNHVITKRALLEQIWDCNEQYVDDTSVTVTISRLRKKLHHDAKAYIQNVFGSGYIIKDVKNNDE